MTLVGQRGMLDTLATAVGAALGDLRVLALHDIMIRAGDSFAKSNVIRNSLHYYREVVLYGKVAENNTVNIG